MSTTTTTTTTQPTSFISTVKGYIAEAYHFAASLFVKAEAVEADISAFDASHPDVQAAVVTLEAMAPAEVKAGINTAEVIVTALGNIAGHATTATKAVAMILMLFGATCLVSGCSALGLVTPSSAAAVTTDLTTAQKDAQNAISLYGIAKGIADVAALADPALAVSLASAEAYADPLVAQAQTALTNAATNAAALEALVAQITAQANAMTVTAATVVKVVPSTAS